MGRGGWAFSERVLRPQRRRRPSAGPSCRAAPSKGREAAEPPSQGFARDRRPVPSAPGRAPPTEAERVLGPLGPRLRSRGTFQEGAPRLGAQRRPGPTPPPQPRSRAGHFFLTRPWPPAARPGPRRPQTQTRPHLRSGTRARAGPSSPRPAPARPRPAARAASGGRAGPALVHAGPGRRTDRKGPRRTQAVSPPSPAAPRCLAADTGARGRGDAEGGGERARHFRGPRLGLAGTPRRS